MLAMRACRSPAARHLAGGFRAAAARPAHCRAPDQPYQRAAPAPGASPPAASKVSARRIAAGTVSGEGPEAAASGEDADAGKRPTLLVLGGNGFVGRHVVRFAAGAGFDVVSISRRGAPPREGEAEPWEARVTWLQGDVVKDPEVIGRAIAELGPYRALSGVVHAIGMLLESGANSLASGSGSIPDAGVSYEQVTAETALAAAEALVAASGDAAAPKPFVFVSAAEAGWTETLGGDPFFAPAFLRRYLAAKRKVEAALQEYAEQGKLRPVILRPSLIWSPARAASFPAVAAFALGNALSLPGVDRPVLVDQLAKAAVVAVRDADVRGIKNFHDMDEIAARTL
eukprot:jgi/Tetstr1/459658/TSEL_005014.t1